MDVWIYPSTFVRSLKRQEKKPLEVRDQRIQTSEETLCILSGVRETSSCFPPSFIHYEVWRGGGGFVLK